MSSSRRVFLKTVSGVAAASFLPVAAQAQPKKIGWCMVGLGRISMQHFMPAVQASERGRLVALVSGHRDKAEQQAAKYGIPLKNIYDYEHYDEIANNPEIDAVYIALPNGMHAEYTIRAAKAGKHVLCEKPMANTAAEAEQMVAACRSARRKLMIGYRCQLHPAHIRAQQMIRDGSIGQLRLIESTFGFNIAKGEWRLTKKLAGGGPMMDVGIYALQACRFLSGEEPVSLSASMSVSTQDGRFTEVEENLFWNMCFPSGVVANCTTSYGSNAGNYFRAIGSKGWVQMEPAFSYEGLRIKAHYPGGPDLDEAASDPDPRQFLREADHFAECIQENREPKTPGEEGVRDMKLIAAIYKSAAADKPLAL